MANVKKWVLKSKNNSLLLNEEIIVALGVAVQNKVKFMATGLIGGATGETAAAMKLKEQENENLSQPVTSIAKYPHGAVIIALTSTRLLVYKLNFFGRPKELSADYARSEIKMVKMNNEKINNSLEITFADGGKVTHDVSLAQGNELKKFVDVLNESN